MINLIDRVKIKIKSIHWPMLLFLIGILNPNLSIKLVSLFLLFLIQPALNLIFRKGRLPIFYWLLIILIGIQIAFNSTLWSKSYFVVTFLGAAFWGVAFLVMHQSKVFVERLSYKKIDNTITLFFLINSIVSFYQLIGVMLEAGAVNPYNGFETGIFYNATVGDWIKGVIGDSSITNASISLFGFIYFFHHKKYWMTLLCLLVVLIATSNLVSIILLFYLIITLILSFRDKVRMAMILSFLTIVVAFYSKVSYSNTSVIVEKITGGKTKILRAEYAKLANKENALAEKNALIDIYLNQKIKKANPTISYSKSNNDTPLKKKEQKEKARVKENEYLQESEQNQQRYKKYIQKNYAVDTLISSNSWGIAEYPGKIVSTLETLKFSFSSVRNFAIGAGPGEFSSSLAFKVSGLNYGGETKIGTFIQHKNQNFIDNHLRIQCYYLQQFNSEHSIINFPYSSFNQILGEYGWIGVLLFVIFYLWFFLKRFKYLTYGREMLLVLIPLLFVDYWFEALSLIIFFELFMFLDLKDILNNSSYTHNSEINNEP